MQSIPRGRGSTGRYRRTKPSLDRCPTSKFNYPYADLQISVSWGLVVGITEFEIHINGVLFATTPPASTDPNGTLFYGETLWTPPAPGTYLIEVIAKGNGQVSSPDQVYVTVIGDGDGDGDNDGDDDGDEAVTPTPTDEIIDEIDEVEGCRYTALVNLNCRLGPGSYYISVGFFLPGQSAPVVGNTADGFYWYVVAPDTGNVCTVPNNTVFGTVEGYCSEPPIFTPVPPPTEIPTPTPTPETGCTVRQAGGEVICVSPCPVGALPGEACTIP